MIFNCAAVISIGAYFIKSRMIQNGWMLNGNAKYTTHAAVIKGIVDFFT